MIMAVEMYKESVKGISLFSDNLVEIIGEQLVINDEGKLLDQYLYNIVGYTAENGKPFASLKANIILL